MMSVFGKIFRPRGVIAMSLVMGALLVYFSFFFDFYLKGAIEEKLSVLNGAPVVLRNIKTNFFRGEVVLSGLEIWIPGIEGNESLKVGEVRFTVLHEPLISRKLVIQKMHIEGVSLGVATRELATPELNIIQPAGTVSLVDRVANSYFTDLKAGIGENPFRRIGILLSGLDLSTEIQRKSKNLSSVKQLEQSAHAVDTLEHDVIELNKSVPDISALLSELRDKEIDEKALAELSKKETELRDWISKTDDRFEVTTKELQKISDRIKEDTRAIMTELNLPRIDGGDLTPLIVGPSLLRYLAKLTYWIDLSRRKMPKAAQNDVIFVSGGDSENGTIVHFGKAEGHPTFQLVEATVHSSQADGISAGDVDGRILNLTSDPFLSGKPTSFTLAADFPKSDIRNLKMSFKIDHRKNQTETINLSAQRFPFQKLALNDAGDLKLFMGGRAEFYLDLTFDEQSLKGALNAQFQNVEFSANSRYRRIEDTVINAVRDLGRFQVTAIVEGAFDKPRFETRSELGIGLGRALSEEFRHQIGAIEDDLRKNILDVVYPQHQRYASKVVDLKQKTLTRPIQQWELTQALQHRAEKLIARSKKGRGLAGSRDFVKKSSKSKK